MAVLLGKICSRPSRHSKNVSLLSRVPAGRSRILDQVTKKYYQMLKRNVTSSRLSSNKRGQEGINWCALIFWALILYVGVYCVLRAIGWFELAKMPGTNNENRWI